MSTAPSTGCKPAAPMSSRSRPTSRTAYGTAPSATPPGAWCAFWSAVDPRAVPDANRLLAPKRQQPSPTLSCGLPAVAVVVGGLLVVVRLVRRRHRVIEVRRVLDLILRHRHVDLARVVIDVAHDARRDQPLVTEDPEARVHHQVVPTGFRGPLVHLTDA